MELTATRRTKAEAQHLLFCVAGELLCEPFELLETVPDLREYLFNPAFDYEAILAYANENC